MLNQQKNATDTSKPVKIGIYTPLMAVLAESYPELQASELFINLKKQIIDTEQKIMLARNYYNDIVFSFNTRIQSFPANKIAMLCQIKPIAPIKIIALKNKAGKK